MATLTIRGAWVDGMLKVDAFADGVALDNFVAHLDDTMVGVREIKVWLVRDDGLDGR